MNAPVIQYGLEQRHHQQNDDKGWEYDRQCCNDRTRSPSLNASPHRCQIHHKSAGLLSLTAINRSALVAEPAYDSTTSRIRGIAHMRREGEAADLRKRETNPDKSFCAPPFCAEHLYQKVTRLTIAATNSG